MADTFNVTSNSQELTAKLNQLAARIAEPQELLEHVGSILERGEQEVFMSEGASINWAWKAIVQPDRKVGGSPLVASGVMKASVAGFGAAVVHGNEVRIHPDPYYSRFHQFGTHTMDARPFTGISEGTMRLIVQEFSRAAGQAME